MLILCLAAKAFAFVSSSYFSAFLLLCFSVALLLRFLPIVCPSLLLRFSFFGRFPVFVWHQNRPPHFIFEKKAQDSKLSE
jgi:hypothetical protein